MENIGSKIKDFKKFEDLSVIGIANF